MHVLLSSAAHVMAQVPDTFSHLRHRRPKYRSEMAFILFRPCKRQFHADEIGYFTDAVRQEEHFAALEGVFVLAVWRQKGPE